MHRNFFFFFRRPGEIPLLTHELFFQTFGVDFTACLKDNQIKSDWIDLKECPSNCIRDEPEMFYWFIIHSNNIEENIDDLVEYINEIGIAMTPKI